MTQTTLLPGDRPIEGCNISRGDIITIENAKIIWPHFSGEADAYNSEGDRNFNIHLTEEEANTLAADGWNVKCKPARKEDPDSEERCVLKVTVKFGYKPPRIKMIGNITRNETLLDEDLVGLLDNAEIEKVDLTFVPYFWESAALGIGVTAYLRTMYVTTVEDELDLKYAHLKEEN